MKNSKLIDLYKKLLNIRLIEETIADKYSEQEMRCPVHLSVGQEASAVGVCDQLQKKDIVYSSHRSHAHYLGKKCNAQKMISEIYGKENGCLGGRGGSMHLQDINNGFFASITIVSSAMGLAVGVALNLKRKKSKNICTVFIGDGSCEEGIFHETLIFSSVKRIPLLIICENNLYSVYTHLKERQINNDFTKFASSHGIKSNRVDGNDVIKVHNETEKAINYIRKTKKPFFLQLDTYRWREHCGPNYDNHIGYRSNSEFLRWKKKCPIKKVENIILKKKLLTKKNLDKISNNMQLKINKFFIKAKKSGFPKASTFNNYVYK